MRWTRMDSDAFDGDSHRKALVPIHSYNFDVLFAIIFFILFYQGIIAEELKLNNFVIKGNWTITALYGHKVI